MEIYPLRHKRREGPQNLGCQPRVQLQLWNSIPRRWAERQGCVTYLVDGVHDSVARTPMNLQYARTKNEIEVAYFSSKSTPCIVLQCFLFRDRPSSSVGWRRPCAERLCPYWNQTEPLSTTRPHADHLGSNKYDPGCSTQQ